ncbi:MAG: hypothetical protein K9H49_17430 [Bacteroidales bacterium]|nr:hypothetical protein [Bacteroidales bacterium]MCF8390200.1 hypothetical protein [Bacteroidales bacterium]
MLFQYRRLFGIFRILLGILFTTVTAYFYFQKSGPVSEESMEMLFVFLFFLMYSYSSIRNGIREINENLPAFNLLRFYEAAMNGFIGLYFLILIFTLDLLPGVRVLFLIIDIAIVLSMVRDLKIISIQYYDKKKEQSKKNKL